MSSKQSELDRFGVIFCHLWMSEIESTRDGAGTEQAESVTLNNPFTEYLITWNSTCCQFCLKGLTRHKVVISTTQLAIPTTPRGVYRQTHTHTHRLVYPQTHKSVCTVFTVCVCVLALRGTAPAKRSGWLLSSLCLSSTCPQLVGPISAIGRFLLAGWWYKAISS